LERKESKYHYLQIAYLNDKKKSTKELLKVINNFSKVAGYKINSKKKNQWPSFTQKINRLGKKLGK
jgi:adenine C2-methylase RlmN of 23S rRNA A2503 and tRNA A37